MTKTKHELILKFISDLEIGTKVSVRQIAKELEVSEGTAYRAIKQAEAQNLVSSIPKVGTIRIESNIEKEIEDLTIGEIASIIEGEFLTGKEQQRNKPKEFYVGANSTALAENAINDQMMVIVSDLTDIQQIAIEQGAALLVTGGVPVNEEIIDLSQRLNGVIISTPYDTFVALSMINKATYERVTERDLVRVNDIMEKKVICLYPEDTVEDWKNLASSTGHSRFPIVDRNNTLLGMVSAIDVAGVSNMVNVSAIMSTELLVANSDTLVSHLSRLLVWEGFELVPVVDENKYLIGVVSRQDLIQALQQTQKQPQFGETVDNLTLSGFKLDGNNEQIILQGKITQFMLNELGVASVGVLTMIISNAAFIAARKSLKWETIVDDFILYQINPVSVEEEIEIKAEFLYTDKKTCKLEIQVSGENGLKCKALTTLRNAKK